MARQGLADGVHLEGRANRGQVASRLNEQGILALITAEDLAVEPRGLEDLSSVLLVGDVAACHPVGVSPERRICQAILILPVNTL